MATETKQNAEVIAAFLAAQKEIGPATKNAKNPFFKSNYADLEEIWNVCKDALHRHGLCVMQPTMAKDGGGIELRTILAHVSGGTIESTFPIATVRPDKDGSLIPMTNQEIGSSVTYARRYALASLLGIVTSDDDGEQAVGRQHEPANTQREPAPTIGAPVPDAYWKTWTGGQKKLYCDQHGVKAAKNEKGAWVWAKA